MTLRTIRKRNEKEMGKHVAFGFLNLAIFTSDDVLQFHPFTCK
jgi:hypothetical protein